MGSWHEDGHQEQSVPGPAREKALRPALLLACTHALTSAAGGVVGASLGVQAWPSLAQLVSHPIGFLQYFVVGPPIGLIPGLPLCVLGWAIFRHVSRTAWLAYALVSHVIVAGSAGMIGFIWGSYVAAC